MQLNLTGGEPLLRDDLEALVAERAAARALHQPDHQRRAADARAAGSACRRRARQRAGVDPGRHRRGARTASPGCDSFEHKLQVAALGQGARPAADASTWCSTATTSDGIAEIIALAESLDADRLELANTQYLGWALVNRERAAAHARAARARARRGARRARAPHAARMEVLFVTPDYYAESPKACMDGWARRFIVIAPDGLRPALPRGAHAARPDVRQRAATHALGEIWRRLARLQRLPRRGLDARAVPELRAPRASTSAAAAARRIT